MRVLFGMALLILTSWCACADGITSVEIDGDHYTGVNKVYVGSDGRIIILYKGGGTSASADKVPANFLSSWNINPVSAKDTETHNAAQQLEREVASGYFREIDGIVYDTRQPQPDWVTIPKARIVQVMRDGAILNITPGTPAAVGAYVKHLPNTLVDTDTFGFTAKLIGNYSYINKFGLSRTIRSYDAGRPCARDEIPTSVLTGQKAFEKLDVAGSSRQDVTASLLESSGLKASGSGFFITDNGYLISNNHVVENAVKVRVVTRAGTLEARVVQVDAANDLALLKVDGKFSPLPIATSRTVHLGASVVTVGFPQIGSQGFAPKFAKGEIAALSGIKDDPKYFQISVPLQHGNSGGALVDEHGNVVGIVSGKLGRAIGQARTSDELPENVNYAVKSSLLLSFLESVPAASDKLESPVVKEQKFDDVVKAAEQAAALVLVY